MTVCLLKGDSCVVRFNTNASLGVQGAKCGTFINSVLHSLLIATCNKQMSKICNDRKKALIG